MEDNRHIYFAILANRIMDAYEAPGNARSLADIVMDYTFGMTREELDIFLRDSVVPKLESALNDLKASRSREESLREVADRERELRKKAEKESAAKEKAIETKDREIERLRKDLEDAKNTNTTSVLPLCCGRSHRLCQHDAVESHSGDC